MRAQTLNETKCLEHLEDPAVYEPQKRGPLSASKQRIVNVINTLEGKLPTPTINTLKPNNTQLGEFYANIKTHKTDFPIRPIVSAINTPPEKLSYIITKILVQGQKKIPTLSSNSYTFKSKLLKKFPHKISPNAILFSLDIKSMYTNIPIDDCILKLLNFISKYHDINLFGLGYPDIENILHNVMNESFFRFGERVFHQKEGLGMGHRYSPPAANIYMFCLEVDLIETWNSANTDCVIDIDKWFRALDDICYIWEYSLEKLLTFVEYANTFHPSLKFTLEWSYSKLNFVDVTISKSTENASHLTTELFIKPTHSGVSLNYNSNHPRHTIINTAMNHFKRAKQLSNTLDAKLRSYQRVSELLLANDFPLSLVNKIKYRVDSLPDKSQKLNSSPKYTLKLPHYNDNLLAECKQAVKLSGLENVMIATAPPRNLKQQLVTTPFTPRKHPRNCKGCLTSEEGTDCNARLVVYSLICLLCLEMYLGETFRAYFERIKEHLRSVLNESEDLTISTHFQECHPEVLPEDRKFKSAIVRKCSDYCELMITEAELIKKLDPSINKYSGKWKLLN